jgi:hypothetical protein
LFSLCEGFEKEAKWLNKVIGRRRDFRFAVFGVEGYGTCFFHSLCYCINYKGFAKANKKIRREIADSLRCNLGKFFTRKRFEEYKRSAVSGVKDSYEKYTKKWCDTKAWADEIMIRHTAEMFGLNIMFVQGHEKGRTFFCGVHAEKETRPTLLVLWVNRQHFEPIVRYFPKTKRVLGLLKRDRPGDSEVIDRLLLEYKSQCHTDD